MSQDGQIIDSTGTRSPGVDRGASHTLTQHNEVTPASTNGHLERGDLSYRSGDLSAEHNVKPSPTDSPALCGAVEDVSDISFIEALEHDQRPTFVIDLTTVHDTSTDILQPVFYNASLSANSDLLDIISGRVNINASGAYSVRPYSRFRTWVIEERSDHVGDGSPLPFEGFLWTRNTIRKHWRVISGLEYEGLTPSSRRRSDYYNTCPQPVGDISATPLQDVVNKRRRSSEIKAESDPHQGEALHMGGDTVQVPAHSVSRLGPWDWTGDILSTDLSTHMAWARSLNWGNTPLGPMCKWSSQLRLMSNIVMKDTNPAVIFWGPDLVMIYNEPYIQLLGEMHPGCMGSSAKVSLRDVWSYFMPICTQNITTGKTVDENDLPLFLDRGNGSLEETYFSFRFIPIIGEDGAVVGHYEPVTETTQQVVSKRRLSTLLKVGEETAKARDLDSYWRLVTQTLSSNDKDVPFALLYAVEDEPEVEAETTSSASSNSSGMAPKQCVLKGSIGVPPDHPAASARLNLQHSSEGFMPVFRQAMYSRQPTVLPIGDDPSLQQLMQGIQWRGFGNPCKSAVICPIAPTSSGVLGFLVIGLNPRRPYDDDYRQFISVASRLLATSLASVVLISQAAVVQERLSEKLLISQREIERTEKKFQRFADRADVGIFITGPDGSYTYRNNKWNDLFQLAANEPDVTHAWLKVVHPEDIQFCEQVFMQLVLERKAVSFELRLKRPQRAEQELSEGSEDVQQQDTWILCSAYPEFSEEGELAEIVGTITDISRQKWGEDIQKRRTEDALESKRQLENFIDTTSHEMRNPLSAILQSADGIISSHDALLRAQGDSSKSLAEFLETGIDAAQTIVQCSQHMKRIVDDVLTMSKLDSGLLMITPVPTRPETVARHAVKMFKGEAKSADVNVLFKLEDSYRQLAVDWVLLDPTRLLQILINLITNAIKFTRFESRRSITVSVGASLDEPLSSTHGVAYIRSATPKEDPTVASDWGTGESIFLHFTVQDTGRGLSADEKQLLFARFSQASPRTHIHYGGSGLGLFISRRLTEMQGGAIGFASKLKAGSTFSFYIKARRTESRPSLGRVSSAPHPDVPAVDSGSDSKTRTVSNGGSVAQKAPVASSSIALSHTEIGPMEDEATVHVLVVEDNLVNQRVLAKQLRNLGCVVDVANHGGEALDYLRKTKYWTGMTQKGLDLSVILMDWEMPVMNGLTCVRTIRQLQRDGEIVGHVPVIAVTANVRSQQISMAVDAGMDDVVSKPFRVPDLLEKMRNLIDTLAR